MKLKIAAIGALAMTLNPGVHAQDRMPPIPNDKLTPAQHEAIAAFREARGTGISGPFVPLLRSPEVMTRTRAMGDYLRFKSTLPPRLSEFVILITARQWTQQYEWHAHHALALKAGLKPEIADAIAQGRRPAAMAPDEEALYDFCDELHRTRGVSDATYERMVAAFGEQGVIDAAGIVGYYTLLAMVMNTARTPLPDGAAPQLSPFPK
jgi:4-carboxymuconolactone decarboxylase